jgi:hypothetical protein
MPLKVTAADQGGVDRDPVQPGAQARATLEAADLLKADKKAS